MIGNNSKDQVREEIQGSIKVIQTLRGWTEIHSLMPDPATRYLFRNCYILKNLEIID